MSDEEGVTFAISGIKDRVLVYGLIALVGGSSIVNLIGPKDNDLLNLGFDDRLDMLELEVEGCKDRNNTHNESQASALATLVAKTQSNEYLIKQCMGRTGL